MVLLAYVIPRFVFCRGTSQALGRVYRVGARSTTLFCFATLIICTEMNNIKNGIIYLLSSAKVHTALQARTAGWKKTALRFSCREAEGPGSSIASGRA
jgi:hypothetical protein